MTDTYRAAFHGTPERRTEELLHYMDAFEQVAEDYGLVLDEENALFSVGFLPGAHAPEPLRDMAADLFDIVEDLDTFRDYLDDGELPLTASYSFDSDDCRIHLHYRDILGPEYALTAEGDAGLRASIEAATGQSFYRTGWKRVLEPGRELSRFLD